MRNVPPGRFMFTQCANGDNKHVHILGTATASAGLVVRTHEVGLIVPLVFTSRAAM